MFRSDARWAVLGLALIFAGGACSKHAPASGGAAESAQPAPEEQRSAVPVQLARVVRQDVVESLEITGVLQPLPGRDVRLGALSSGRVAQVFVSEGDEVQQGQVLLKLEQTALADAVAQTEANVAQARAQLELARTKLKSAEGAWKAGVAARQEVDDARAAQVTAESALRSAQAAASTAHNELARSELRAPFNGLVAHVFVAAGEPVDASGKPLIEVVDNSVLELRGGVSAQAAAQVHPGMGAEVQLQAPQPVMVPGKVIAVSPVVDATTGLVTVRIRVENATAQLKAGTPARARIVIGQHEGALTVPRSAIVPLQQGENAPSEAELQAGAKGFAVEWVDGSDTVHRRPVALGAQVGDRIEVRSGLSEGDRVVSEGAYALPDGTKVIDAAATPPNTDGGQQ